MNKLFTKIAGLTLGLAMAVGVGVAVGHNGKEAEPVRAAESTRLTLNTASTTIATGNSYASYSESSTAYKWAITCGSKQSAGLWLGSNNTQKAKMILSNGSLSDASGIATAIGVTTSATYYAAIIQTASTIANVDKVTLTYTTPGGTAPSEAWILYSTTGTTWNVFQKVTSLSTSGTNFTHAQVASARYAFVIHSTGYCQFKVPVLTFKGTDATTQTITTDPASGEAYTDESISLTTNASSASWALSNNTCGASLSAASGKTVSVSATSAGSVRVTATASGYTSPYVDLTFNEKPTDPFITPEKASASGYTGTNESISFAYGNLTGSLGVTSSNTSVVTVGTPSYSDGEGSVQFNYVGAGSTTVKFKDGSTECASVNVSVTASSVSITGMPASKSVANGSTLNLGALITVTATGSYSSDVTWSTSDSTKVSITQAGVATGEAVGSATITVTPDDYPAGAVSCTVTVANMISATFATGTTDGSALTSDDAIKGVSGYSVDDNIEFTSITACYGGVGYALKFGASGTKGSITVGLIDGEVNSKSAYITKIVINAIAYGTDTTTLLIAGTENSLTSSWADYDEEFDGTSTTTVTIEAKIASKNRFRISSIEIYYGFNAELSSVTTSGQTTSFTQGGSFAYGGTLTAHYTAGKADATVTPTAYKYGASGFNPASAGTAITIGTTLSVDTHNGKYVSVGYTEGGITKWTALYQITVSYAAVTSVALSENTAEIGLNELFDYNLVTVTVSPSNADQGYTWSVSANTVGDDYVFDGSGLLSGDTDGTITLRCESDADSSKYATLVVTVTGDPTASFVKESTSGYAGKSESIAFTYGNIDDESKITVASSNTNYVTVANDLVADEGEGFVTINFVAEGSANVTISYDGGSTLDTLSVTVNADSVVSVSWNASNFDVFSGATLTSDIDNTWLASYETASGNEDLISYGEYTLKLGGSPITLPHTWAAADSGKNLCIEYGGVSSSTVSVTVTQSINPVYAPNTDTNTVSWTASAASDLGSQISEVNGTDEGTISTGDYEWGYTRTLVSLASNKSDYIAFQGSTWIQLGSGNALESLEFTTSAIPGTIKSVSVVAATAGTHALTIDVGGTKYLEDEALHVYSGTAAAANPDPADCVKTGTGSSSGAITITIAQSGSTKKAMVIRSISVTYETEGGGSTNIANNASHKAAQRVAVAFANAFNAAMDDTENCTTGLDAAWSTCSSAYNTFKNQAAALGETEEAWAKNLIKYATAQYSDDSGEACIERMMKTYEICVQKHGKTAFMNDLVSLGRAPVNPLTVVKSNANAVAIVIVSSVIAACAVGGYFFLRKKKED